MLAPSIHFTCSRHLDLVLKQGASQDAQDAQVDQINSGNQFTLRAWTVKSSPEL
jgi:hypothetical protein